MKRFVILGGGYGGLTVAQQLLEGDLPEDTVIVLIDRMPYQGLKTEYYSLVAGTVADIDLRVAYPSDPRLIVTYGEVTDVDLHTKQVIMAGQEPLEYEWLVVALGCTDKYHGIEGAELFSNSIQTFSASRKTYQALNDVKPYGQVTIVGGGLSGVEVASELREGRPDLNIRIIDRGPSILSAFPPKLQAYVSSWFIEHEVEMRGHVALSRLEEGVLYDQNNPASILTDVTVWTAGIQPVALVQRMDLPKDNQGRLIINEFHQLPDHTDVFIVGDCASLPFSPSAQAAEGQGKQVAEVMQAIWKNKTPKLGKIKLKGVLGSLGKKSGFGLMGRTPLMGRVPRVLKSGVLWMSKHHLG
ncbi:NADH dehydrogenase-like protein YutJ [Paenibacillus baekrokdamisoli]|uniref:NADH dehydrogenase-like protein YutJ n=1 Tax=Paenibacillus baekrokdamisoli TaxID=1712516 RepID=A0A3G9JFD3_9BACL|nr:FAD-dependent oxidoreductase [Paenibacillus baekrokdamisoli]MBB3071252.1 NADH dehydrogenase [Paenibacillus baekrokdamisoli]BBH21669.1 NADH dehydrogenase-like protein YutJ [Paenibacillus baekrokdamisoli]